MAIAFISKSITLVFSMTREELEKIDWSTHCLKTNYHKNEADEVYIKVLGIEEVKVISINGTKEKLCFKGQPYENQGYKVAEEYLDCDRLGKYYDIVEIPEKYAMKQMSIFDFIED